MSRPDAPVSRLGRALAAIDAANAGDPERLTVDGVERPKEQAHAEMMTEWVGRLDPTGEEAQLIAARAHHLRRWTVPRDAYPEGRTGYLRWRTALRRQHADDVAAILAPLGYPDEVIERVAAIVTKQGLGRDPQVQTHEDALCLVFLMTQFDDLAERLGDDRIVDVVRKTLAKMSERGRAEALDLALSDHGRAIVAKAMAPS